MTACRVVRTLARLLGWSLLAGVTLPTEAAAKNLLGSGTGANYQVPIMSWSEIPFRTVVRQQYDFSCGSAAVATLLSYHYGHQIPERSIFGAMWAVGDRPLIRKFGFSMLDIKQYLDNIGFKTEGFRLSLDQLRAVDHPGIIILNVRGYKHFVVVKGVTKDQILVGDPMIGLTRYTAMDLASHWNGIFLTIVDSPDHHQPGFNLATDWRRWSVAPLRGRTSGPPIAGLTDNLPPIYQITPGVLSGTSASAVR